MSRNLEPTGAELFVTIGLIVLSLTFGPILTIWALNLIFGFVIPVNFYTWAATLWLAVQFGRK